MRLQTAQNRLGSYVGERERVALTPTVALSASVSISRNGRSPNREYAPLPLLTSPTRALQRDRVLDLLLSRGETGVTQADFSPPRVVDGGKPIARLASRIDELRNGEGLPIVDAGWRSNLRVYRLLLEGAVDEVLEPPARLFEDDGGRDDG